MAYSSKAYRMIELAARFARILGYSSCAWGAIVATTVYFEGADRKLPAVAIAVMVSMVAAPMILPGILYIAFAASIARRRKWAVITVLVLACLHVVPICIYLWLLIGPAMSGDVGAGLFIQLALLILVVLLISSCIRSFPALQPRDDQYAPRTRGFEPVVQRPVPPQTSFPMPPKSLRGPSKPGT
jgi:hypothetical protein